MMRAAQVHELSGVEGVRVCDVASPVPQAGEVLIDVRAVGLSSADLLMARGQYQKVPEPPFTIGMDLAGTVAGCGDAVRRASIGDRVAATVPYGAAADYVVVPERMVFPLPAQLSYAEGAAMPVNYLTVYFALSERAGLREGETVLIHGAAGGIGSAAVQVARALGARVIAVVSSGQKAQSARDNGADEVVFVEGFKDSVMAVTDGNGVDIVVDTVGAQVINDSLRCLRFGGRHLVLGFAGGQAPPMVKANRLLLRNIDVRGVSWGGHADADGRESAAQWSQLVPLMESGVLRPQIGGRYPLEEIAEALTDLESRRAIGKIIVETGGSRGT